MSEFKIEKYKFEPWNKLGCGKLRESEPIKSLEQTLLGTNWPVVYILYSDSEEVKEKQLYVGESTSATQRMSDHLKNSERAVFNAVRIIFDKKFNKSAILDVEQSLINLFYADNPNDNLKYTLQNRNEGQSNSHDYYDRAYYQGKVREIWEDLRVNSDIKIDKGYNEIINSKLFKFSPHTVLTEEQNDVCVDVLENVFSVLENWNKAPHPYVASINGKAGTGKTIVLMHMFGMLEECRQMSTGKNSNKEKKSSNDKRESFNTLIGRISNYKLKNGLNFAYVCSCDSLHKTMSEVIRGTYGRRTKGKGKVVKPVDIGNAGEKDEISYDIVFIDEAHRLFRRPVGMGTKSFGEMNIHLFSDNPYNDGKDYTQMDWILKKAKCVVMVYDENQTVRDADMNPEQFKIAFDRVQANVEKYPLLGQMRCNGGSLFIDFLDKLLSPETQPEGYTLPDLGSYEVKLFDNAPSLIDAIANNDEEYGLCRTICGPGWQYKSGKYKKEIDEFKKSNDDIYNNPETRKALINNLIKNLKVEDGILSFLGEDGKYHKYVRNLSDWVLKGNPYEIGCIHMVQGYDLNYVGIIFSKEIDYDNDKGRIIIYRGEIEDRNSMASRLSPDKVEQYVKNTYKVLMSRGVQGCYLYAVNKGMQEYLKSFFCKS